MKKAFRLAQVVIGTISALVTLGCNKSGLAEDLGGNRQAVDPVLEKSKPASDSPRDAVNTAPDDGNMDTQKLISNIKYGNMPDAEILATLGNLYENTDEFSDTICTRYGPSNCTEFQIQKYCSKTDKDSCVCISEPNKPNKQYPKIRLFDCAEAQKRDAKLKQEKQNVAEANKWLDDYDVKDRVVVPDVWGLKPYEAVCPKSGDGKCLCATRSHSFSGLIKNEKVDCKTIDSAFDEKSGQFSKDAHDKYAHR